MIKERGYNNGNSGDATTGNKPLYGCPEQRDRKPQCLIGIF